MRADNQTTNYGTTVKLEVDGNPDFTSLVKRVKRMGPRVEVIGFPRNTAKTLLEAADTFHALDRKFMIYPDRAQAQRTEDKKTSSGATKPARSAPLPKAKIVAKSG